MFLVQILTRFFFNFSFGVPFFVLFFAIGLAMSATIVLLPFGTQFLKLSKLALGPSKYSVTTSYSSYTFLNVIWDLTFGLVIGLCYFIVGLVFCVSIVGFFLGRHYFKIARFAFAPFGAKIQREWQR